MAQPRKQPAKKAPAKKAAAPTRKPVSKAVHDKAKAVLTEAAEAMREADEAGLAAVSLAEEIAPDDPLLDTAIRQIEAGATDTKPYGEPGAPMGVRSPLRIAFSATIGVGLAVLLFQSIILARSMIIIIVVSMFLAIGLNPGVEFLERRGMRRGRAVFLIFIVLLTFVVGFLAAAIPPVVDQTSELVKRLPEYAQRFRDDNAQFRRLDDQFHIVEKLRERFSSGELIQTGGEQLVNVAKGLLTVVFNTLTMLVLTLYFLGGYPRIKRSAYRLVPRSRRARFGLLADEILSRVGGYVLGNIATSIIAGIVGGTFLAIIGVPYPVALGMLIALLDLIPLIGASLAAVVCVFVAFFVDVPHGLGTLAFFLAYQQVENYVLVPKVMQKTVNVSPLATILAALIGGTLLGVVGALLAIPVAAAIQLIGTEVLHPRQDAA